ncbi:restriction endonuclease subunit S [Xanthomonas sp. DAR33341]|uniref:restriction endonuclease subunit S n=1 Tax=Xanthomonas sp. DAR33341 TaxID=2182387 RepID=UPI000F8F2AFA|nr:restriction endonuclease subunit S [Xanthomonas sp. DAR33341]
MMALLTGNLPLLAGSPNGIKKLRELILELAVRGKLVPQDPNDEPASELLKRITEEKVRLVAIGQIKKPKPLEGVAAEEWPFELPVGWEWSRLGEVSTYIQRGKGPVYVEQSDFRVVSQKCVRWAGLDLKPARFVAPESLVKYEPIRFLRSGDILWNSTGTGTIGRACVVENCSEDEKLVVDSHVTIVRPTGLLPVFLWRWIQSPSVQSELEGNASGTTNQIELNTSKVIAHLTPIPPLAEQHRIVAKVDELMTLCDRLEARQGDADSAHAQLVQALLDSLTQASDAEDFAQSWQRLADHFHTLFSTESSIGALKQTLLQLAVMGKLVPQDSNEEPAHEAIARFSAEKKRLSKNRKIKEQLEPLDGADKPFGLPPGWMWQWMPDVSFFQEGPGIMAKDFRSSGVPLIRISGMHGSFVSLDGCNFLEEDMAEGKWSHFRLELGDIVLSASASLGKVAKIGSDTVGSIAYTGLVRFKVFEFLFDDYLVLFLRSSEFARQIDNSKKGAAISHFGPTHLRKMIIPVPPFKEQQRIVAKVDQLMALCDQLKSRLSEARQVNEHLTNALIGQALSGEKKSGAEVVDFSAYLISKLASQRTFGRVAHMKLLFLADSHLGLGLMDGYRRHAAGPLDTSIYRVEERAAQEGLYTTSVEVLKSGQEKVSYHIGANISRSVEMAAAALGAGRKELDRLIALFEGRKTDDLEAVATLYAFWNDALAEGLHPDDEWLINEFRGNWHEAKERFTRDILGKWLGWMRDHGLVPTGHSAVTKSQAAFLFN